MDTSKLKKFASFARTSLIEQVGTRLKSVLADQSLARRENAAAVAELEKKIKELGKERVIDMVAYTWFNRFCALRFMDVNQYTTIGTVSPAEGFTQPEILTEAKQGVIDEELKVDRAKILGLLDGTRPSQDAQGEVYQQLLIAVCNSYHKLMPFMFEKIADYTELLIPEDLLSDSSVLSETRKALTVENCADVEVIGWLYQFYISEKKDDVFAALKKGKKITPENIPAATQLFTPHWIVRYLVENSLGRLWMLNRPDSKLVEQMDYYIKPEEPESDYLRISSPEEIKICDPACGSGHMLTYTFDLLYAIYEEQGYQSTDIPRLILKHNLYGIEIDQRAGALAAFALVMKARQKDRRFFSRMPLDEDSSTAIQNPNVCVLENISIDPEDLSAYMDKVGRDLFTGGLQGVVNQWEESDNFGSLIRPMVTDVSDVLEMLRERQMDQDLFLADVHQKVLKTLRQADYLSPKYHIVVANPPYAGSGSFNPSLKSGLKRRNYTVTRSDLYAAFIQRSESLLLQNGTLGMVTRQDWLFTKSYAYLREQVLKLWAIQTLALLGKGVFETLTGEVVQPVAFVLAKAGKHEDADFIRLIDVPLEHKAESLTKLEYRHRTNQDVFERMPLSPFIFWETSSFYSMFADRPSIDETLYCREGIHTGKNELYIKFHWEVNGNDLVLDAESYDDVDFKGTYVPYNKGGSTEKWFGGNDFVLAFNQINRDAMEQLPGHVRPSESLYFLEGGTWADVASSGFGIRYYPAGFLFDGAGPVVCGDKLFPALACMNSKPFYHACCTLMPNLHFKCGTVKLMPYATGTKKTEQNARDCIQLSKDAYDSFETSLGFSSNPVLTSTKSSLAERIASLYEEWSNVCLRIKHLEEENNSVYIAAFGRTDSLSAEVSEAEISTNINPAFRYGPDKNKSELEALLLADTMREFISYSVGCMLGRYSLDKPGLILANQGETADDYRRQVPDPTFAPDEDNVIPLLDGDWFEDDISERFKAFLKVTFGTEHYDENLMFLENALYPDNGGGKKRKTIRDYFLKDFYNHHIKLYKKRPIYWLFSSPKGTFNALIYMHRYRPDTVGTVLHYLRDFRDKLTHHAEHQQMLADSASASKSEKTQAIKDVAAIKKQLKELEDYEKTLFEVAARKIDIDLDDGVKHNYQLFGSVLRKIPGLDAKED